MIIVAPLWCFYVTLMMVVEVHLGLHGFNCKIQPLLTTLAVCSTAVNSLQAIHGVPVVKHDNSREEEAKAQ